MDTSDLATEMGVMQERITYAKRGSIHSVQAIYVLLTTLPTPLLHLSRTWTLRTVLSRKISSLNLSAVDPLDSTSLILTPDIVGEEHYRTAQRVKETCNATPNYKILLQFRYGRVVGGR